MTQTMLHASQQLVLLLYYSPNFRWLPRIVLEFPCFPPWPNWAEETIIVKKN
jgi:hypothetical protein